MVNDKSKANRKTRQLGDYYVLINDGFENKLNQQRISFTYSLLYFK